MMSTDTDRTPEHESIYEKLVELTKLIEHHGRKVKSLHIEFESSVPDSPEQSTRTRSPKVVSSDQGAPLSKLLTEAEPESGSRTEPQFVLLPVDDNDPMTDAFLKWLKEHESSQ